MSLVPFIVKISWIWISDVSLILSEDIWLEIFKTHDQVSRGRIRWIQQVTYLFVRCKLLADRGQRARVKYQNFYSYSGDRKLSRNIIYHTLREYVVKRKLHFSISSSVKLMFVHSCPVIKKVVVLPIDPSI